MTMTVKNGCRMVFTGVLLAALSGPVNAQMAIPTDVQNTCAVDSATFDTWFESGQPTKDGAVNPADSVTFTTDNSANGGPDVCDFYQWGAQMFLWLTSPADTGQWVFDAPGFYDVSPAVDNKRMLIPNNGPTNSFALRATKTDDNPEDIGEVGQAGGGGVLLSQKGGLVYYGIHVNEVYGYFLTGQMDGKLPDATTFPRNAADLAGIQTYVKKAFPDVTLDDPQTLTMELKTSWVDAATVSDPSQYVTIKAEVPAYTKSTDVWSPNGTEQLTLALVGMHVVGTVQDHPEFIWSSFEHISNAPDADYSYTNTSGQTVNQPYSSAGDFLFMAKGGTVRGANVECIHVDKGDIVPTLSKNLSLPPMTNCAGGFVPSNTVRSNPWGSPGGDNQPPAVIKNNTLLLSINNSVISQLSDGDVRKNYVQIGGIWTTTSVDAPIPNQTNISQRGSLKLSNSTMETYQQGTNCFDCHQLPADATNSFGAFDLSHIYSEIVPLTAPVAPTKCTAAEGSLQFLKGGVTCQGAQTVTAASPPCGNQNYQPFSVGDGLGTWETQDQCSDGGGQQPYKSESGAQSFMWYSCTRYPGDC